jgi:hypothetical protein
MKCYIQTSSKRLSFSHFSISAVHNVCSISSSDFGSATYSQVKSQSDHLAKMSSSIIRKIKIEVPPVPLGEGGYGSVFSGKFERRQVAVKRVVLFNVSENEEKSLQMLDHPNVIKLFHSESDENFK